MRKIVERRILKLVLLILAGLLLLTGLHSPLYAEGTKQVRPDSTISEAGLMVDELDPLFTRFCLVNCPANYRLNIHIKNTGEKILFGLRTPYAGLGWQLRKPNGAVAMSGASLPLAGPGFITYYKQAITGPFPASGGYTPLEFTADMTGDWYFELTTVGTDPVYPTFTDCAIFHLWDFQVVSGANTPALPSDTLNGRVWSQSWQMYAKLETPKYYNGSLYVYSDDGIVTKLVCNTVGMGEGTFFCNEVGCLNTGNFPTDRQSKNTNTFVGFPAIAQYKVFLNNPDTSVYPSGEYGILNSVTYHDESSGPCTFNKYFVINVNKVGQIVLKIDVPYGDATYDVQIIANVVPGDNIVPWNCLDGQGNPVPNGTTIIFTVEYLNGLTNLPLWDFERNPFGYKVYPVRPIGPGLNPPMLYWDDSQLTPVGGGTPCSPAPNSVNLIGCVPATSTCHDWSIMCHNKMINTWWYSGSTTSTASTVIITTPPIPALSGNSGVCINTTNTYTTDPGMTNYLWTVSAGGTITAGGGLSDDFVTVDWNTAGPNSVSVNYLNSSGCTGLVPTVINVTVTGITVPTVSGPVSMCQNTSGHHYLTEAGQTGYVWAISAGGTITAGQGTNNITVTWTTAGGRWVSVIYNGCGAVVPTVYPVTVNPVTIPIITGPNSACRNSSSTFFTQTGMSAYQWTMSGGGGLVNPTNTSQVTVNWNNTSGVRWVRVIFTNEFGCTASAPTQFNVTVALSLIANVSVTPSQNPVCAGSSVTFTANPVNGGASPLYQWRINGVNVGPNGPSPTYTFVPVGGEQVRVVMTSSLTCTGGTSPATSPAVIINTTPLQPVSVSIGASANPVCAGTSVTFTATPTNGGAGPLYQWKVNGINAGASSTTYSYVPVNGDVISCDLTSNVTCPTGNPATSNAISMVVNSAPVSLSITPSENPVCVGTPVTFTAVPVNSGAIPAYQWKVNGVNMGTNNPVFTYTPVNGDLVTCVLTSNVACPVGNPATSNVVTMTVNEYTLITLQPIDMTVGAGLATSFTFTASGNGLAYQWQENSGSGWSDIIDGGIYSGAQTTALTLTGVTPAMDGNQYRSIVTGFCNVATTDVAILTVTTGITISCQAGISISTAANQCTASLDPGFPTLVLGTLPVTYTWVMSGATTASGSGPILPNPYTFNRGVTLITWTATNIDGFDECTQTITITDNQLPLFTAPVPKYYCVEDIFTADYWDPTMDITPVRPDYYLFHSGNTDLNINPATFTDNCPLVCGAEIRWRISFADGSFLPALPALYNTGQISAYPSDIQFPGSATADVVHTITYQIVDCNGNVSLPVSITVTVSPRPNVIKTP